MKPYSKTTNPLKIDRIEKAVALIESGKVMEAGQGVFRVFTERFNGAYTVTLTTCDCPDFEETKEPCKHLWAAIGATAAMLISGIRKAESVTTLEAIGKAYAAAMKAMPQVFANIARSEYRMRYDALMASDEELMILIKPQPKSNGSFNGIEI
jgi:hypothetical protein